MAAEAELVTAQLRYAKERCCLLIQINSTVQSLLACGLETFCHTLEGLSQITKDLERIFNHGLRDQQGTLGNKCDFRVFLNNLTPSCPESSPPEFSPDEGSAASASETNGHDWLQQALLDRSLSLLIVKLVNHKQLLEQLYLEHAFLRSDPHVKALCTCLQAIEKDEPDLLCQVDHILLNKSKYIDQWWKDSTEFTCSIPDTLNSVPALSNNSSGIEIVYSDSNNREKDEFQTASSHSSPSDNHIEISDGAVDFADGFQPYVPQAGQNFSCMPKGTQAYSTVTNGINIQEQTVKTGIHRTAGEKRTAVPLRKKIGLKATLAHAALSAVVESDEMASSPAKWFDGNDNGDCFHKLRRTNSLNDNLLYAHSGMETAENKILKSSTITNVGFESTKNMVTASFTGVHVASESEDKRTDISFHERKKAIGHNRSKSDQLRMVKLNQQNIDVTVQEKNDKKHHSSFSGVSRMSSSLPTGTESLYYNDPFLEDPYQEESLATILASQDFSSCELDKENAHFSISEALISAIEQMKCDGIDSSEDEEDDEEILHLKEALEKKRQEKKRGRRLLEQAAFSDGTTQSTTSDPSGESVFESEDELDHDWEEIKTTDEQLQEYDNNFAISTPTPTSEGDSSSTEVAVSPPMSAETVAKSLLQKFANRKHPAASELQWLVSFKDAPQSLLPLPQTVAVAPDDAVEDEGIKSIPISRQNSLPCRMRGNLDWAPPRPQIIFHAHNPPRRKVLMMFQNYRCAGCGMAVAPDYMKRFRYCHYLGKYFCSSCHNNFLEVIPARVVRKWDFKRYEVSNFARDLLNRIHYEPFFNIMDLNGALLKRVRVLQDLKDIRRQLHHFKTFIQTCRKGQELSEEFSKLPEHICREPCLYSMHDLLQARDGSLVLFLKALAKSSLNHISQCQLCLAKGFICEYCKNGDDVIFPFELNRVVQCAACRASFHKDCFVEGKCPKCERIRIRKQMINEPVTPDDNPD